MVALGKVKNAKDVQVESEKREPMAKALYHPSLEVVNEMAEVYSNKPVEQPPVEPKIAIRNTDRRSVPVPSIRETSSPIKPMVGSRIIPQAKLPSSFLKELEQR